MSPNREVTGAVNASGFQAAPTGNHALSSGARLRKITSLAGIFCRGSLATACQEASKRGFAGLSSEQSIYHLNNRMLELEVIPACRHYGLGLIPWSPLGGGLLGGALEKLESGRRTSEESLKEINKNRPKLEQYEALCKQLGESPAAVALA